MRKSVIFALMVLASVAVYGRQLTPDEALRRVGDDAMGRRRIAAMSLTDASSRLIYTVAERDMNICYVFGNAAGSGGYVVVSADDCAVPLLGYADSGSFDPDDIPPAMTEWLENYADEIVRASGADSRSAHVRAARPARTPIAPLVATRWNQNAPYNDLCPSYRGRRCVTGCVATAMAQVMKYHNYPERGNGMTRYEWNDTTLAVDFASTEYDWSNMLADYSAVNASDAQNRAVATLMYSCGVSVKMQYSPSESGALETDVASALYNRFGYDRGITYYDRDYFGLYDWEAMIYNQLSEVGPVIYSGRSNSGGHCFVCDGYSTDGYFHFNWGWGGMSDGYFLLTALDPASQGIGGSIAGYNFDQSVIAGIRKPQEGSAIALEVIADGDFVAEESRISLGSQATFSGPFYSFSVGAVKAQFGIKITSNSGISSYAAASSTYMIEPFYGLNSFSVTLPRTLAAGTYTVTPVVRNGASGSWVDIRTRLSDVRKAVMTVSGSTATFAKASAATVSVVDVAFASPLYSGKKAAVKATLTNPGADEFYGVVSGALLDLNGYLVAYGDEYAVDIMPGETARMEYVSAFDRYPEGATAPRVGSYYFAFVNQAGSMVSNPVAVDLEQAPAGNVSLSVTNFRMTDGNTSSVDPDNLSVSGTVACTSGYFADALQLMIFPYVASGTVQSIARISSDPIFLSAGNSQPFSIGGSFTGTTGNRYMACVYMLTTTASSITSTQLTSPLIFVLGAGSSISTVSADNVVAKISIDADHLTVDGEIPIDAVAIYDINGRRVVYESADLNGRYDYDLSALSSGNYFVIVYPADGSAPQAHQFIRR